ncbi:NAD(P)-dependent oxidoreductase [Paenibacillus sp.]|uniref:NAD(P)-dependent oxidoreductase n=1 Tax=Paenibacillus sp. TaxID=58172 RepID=UPI003563178B
MKITVFGLTGPLGMELIKQALEAGHAVVAFARSIEKLSHLTHERLDIIKGDLSNRTEIERAVTGVDAVISLLGPKGKIMNTELSDGVNIKS